MLFFFCLHDSCFIFLISGQWNLLLVKTFTLNNVCIYWIYCGEGSTKLQIKSPRSAIGKFLCSLDHPAFGYSKYLMARTLRSILLLSIPNIFILSFVLAIWKEVWKCFVHWCSFNAGFYHWSWKSIGRTLWWCWESSQVRCLLEHDGNSNSYSFCFIEGMNLRPQNVFFMWLNVGSFCYIINNGKI